LRFCLRVQFKTRACQQCAHPRSQFAHPYAIDVFFFDFSVPVVQRIEQGFPKGKRPLLHKSADVVSCAQIAAIEPVELLVRSSRVITNLHIFTCPGDTKGDTNFSTVSFAWPLVTSRTQSGLMRTMETVLQRRSFTSLTPFLSARATERFSRSADRRGAGPNRAAVSTGRS
jgi:hypothetical protein